MKKIYIVLLISLFQFAIPQLSHADASCNIGIIFYDKGDYAKAFKHMKKLANYKNACAKYYLGLMYFNGQGTKKNMKLAFKYIDAAEKLGYKDAIGFYDRQE